MKKLLLASAIAALSVSAANAAPTVYGKAFLTVDYLDSEKTYAGSPQQSEDINESGLNSNSSRIGLKGSEPLTANTDVVYKLEYGIDIDANDNGKDQFYSRDTYLGLTNAQYGTFLAGRLTSIDDNIDFADSLEGNNNGDVGPTFNEPRLNNAFAYVSPDYNGAQFMAMYAIDADTDSGSIDDEEQYGVGAKFETGPAKFGATYIGHGDDNHIRVAAGYTFNPEWYVGGYYQMSEFGVKDNDKQSPFAGAYNLGDDKENTLVVATEYTNGSPWTYYGQVSVIDNYHGVDSSDALGVGVGTRYNFNKSAIGHFYLGYADVDGTEYWEQEALNPVTNKIEVVDSGYYKTNTDGMSVGAGLEYKF